MGYVSATMRQDYLSAVTWSFVVVDNSYKDSITLSRVQLFNYNTGHFSVTLSTTCCSYCALPHKRTGWTRSSFYRPFFIHEFDSGKKWKQIVWQTNFFYLWFSAFFVSWSPRMCLHPLCTLAPSYGNRHQSQSRAGLHTAEISSVLYKNNHSVYSMYKTKTKRVCPWFPASRLANRLDSPLEKEHWYVVWTIR